MAERGRTEVLGDWEFAVRPDLKASNFTDTSTMGETTAGTNGNVNRLALPGGYTIGWTGDEGAEA